MLENNYQFDVEHDFQKGIIALVINTNLSKTGWKIRIMYFELILTNKNNAKI